MQRIGFLTACLKGCHPIIPHLGEKNTPGPTDVAGGVFLYNVFMKKFAPAVFGYLHSDFQWPRAEEHWLSTSGS
jgi:hypothetical protein